MSTKFSKSYSTYNSPKIHSVGVNVFHTPMTKLIDAVRTGLKILKITSVA